MNLTGMLVEDEAPAFRPVEYYKNDDGTMDERKQMMKIQEEYGEVLEAYGVYKEYPGGRNRLNLALEVIDTITACCTFLDGLMPDEDIKKAIIMVNLKNELSGYMGSDDEEVDVND